MSVEVVEFYSRHLIGIGWYEGAVNERGEFTERPKFYGASGFLLQPYDNVPELCFLITAGHVFTEHDERMFEPRRSAQRHSILDIWGPDSKIDARIPFNLFEGSALVRYEPKLGIDFAVVNLPALVVRLLQQTTTPFTASDWRHQENIVFDSYAMLGLSIAFAKQFIDFSAGKEWITTRQIPVLLNLKPRDSATGVSPTANSQFVAQIDPRAEQESIVGMSGGPIFGFHKNDKGQMRYWPLAIQSRWRRRSRLVIGTLLAPIASEIEREIEKIIAPESS